MAYSSHPGWAPYNYGPPLQPPQQRPQQHPQQPPQHYSQPPPAVQQYSSQQPQQSGYVPAPSHYQNGPRLPPPQQRTASERPSLSIPQQPSNYSVTPDYPPSAGPPTRSLPSSTPSDEGNGVLERARAVGEPYPISRCLNGYAFALHVVQEPDRARMCGFGDKDRRPISPPPCIRLLIMDEKTGVEVDYNKIEDLSRYILVVDLADVDTLKESNMVVHLSNHNNPAIGSSERAAFPPTHGTLPSHVPQPRDYDVSRVQAYQSTQFHGTVSSSGFGGLVDGNGHSSNGGYGGSQHTGYGMPPPPAQSTQPQSCSRNLIGSLSATSFKLNDPEDKVGLWFIFQDLSIRTEGVFRLKFTFFDLMCQLQPMGSSGGERLSEFAPMLASIYSKPFQVWSAKKFPGVRPTTELSQTFADQGIKIPVRKNEGKGDDKKRKRGRNGDSDDDADEPEQDDNDADQWPHPNDSYPPQTSQYHQIGAGQYRPSDQ